jgi:molecular chaperone DnaK
VSDLKTVLDKDDKEAIEAKTAALAEASGSLAQKLYAEQEAEAPADDGPAGADDDVVDAEFEEVDKDDDAKSA